MIIRDPHFFIKKNITSLHKNLLKLSLEQINEQLKEIYRLAQQEFFEYARLQKLLTKITKKTRYYYKRQNQLYNYNALIRAIALSLILFSAISFYLFVCNHNTWLSIGMILITIYLVKKIRWYIHIFFNPQYKEYYEKYAFMEQKVQKRIIFVQKKLNPMNATDILKK